jgi:hypothetical protein
MATVSKHHIQLEEDLSLSDLLADPIIHLVMACDSVTKNEVERLFAAVRAKLASSQAEPCQKGHQVFGAIAFVDDRARRGDQTGLTELAMEVLPYSPFGGIAHLPSR